MDAGSEAFLEQWVDAIAGSRSLLLVNSSPGVPRGVDLEVVLPSDSAGAARR